MAFRPTTIERAYQLAAGGDCQKIGDIKMALKIEGFGSIQNHLYGLTITRALRKLCDENYSVPVPSAT